MEILYNETQIAPLDLTLEKTTLNYYFKREALTEAGIDKTKRIIEKACGRIRSRFETRRDRRRKNR